MLERKSCILIENEDTRLAMCYMNEDTRLEMWFFAPFMVSTKKNLPLLLMLAGQGPGCCPRPTHTFTKVSAQVYLLYELTIENTFKNLCLLLNKGQEFACENSEKVSALVHLPHQVVKSVYSVLFRM